MTEGFLGDSMNPDVYEEGLYPIAHTDFMPCTYGILLFPSVVIQNKNHRHHNPYGDAIFYM